MTTPEKNSDFPRFLRQMQGTHLLHLGHKEGDCDALGSAYALSRLLPGDIGFALGLKAQASSLADWLDVHILEDPDPSDYQFTIIYDTVSPAMLGVPVPSRYAIIDHHEVGGHRYSTLHNQLAEGAEWAWVKPAESTCSIIIDLFQAHSIEMDHKMAVALAAGVVTDTARLRQAHARALQRLAVPLQAWDLYVEDIWDAIENTQLRAQRRTILLEALKHCTETQVEGWSILVTTTHSQDHGIAVLDALEQLGADVVVVGFPKREASMVMTGCRAGTVAGSGIDLGGLMKALAVQISADDAWGNNARGRIIAPLPVDQLTALCLDRITGVLKTT